MLKFVGFFWWHYKDSSHQYILWNKKSQVSDLQQQRFTFLLYYICLWFRSSTHKLKSAVLGLLFMIGPGWRDNPDLEHDLSMIEGKEKWMNGFYDFCWAVASGTSLYPYIKAVTWPRTISIRWRIVLIMGGTTKHLTKSGNVYTSGSVICCCESDHPKT